MTLNRKYSSKWGNYIVYPFLSKNLQQQANNQIDFLNFAGNDLLTYTKILSTNFHYLDKFMSHLPGSCHTLLEVLHCFGSISIFPSFFSEAVYLHVRWNFGG